MSSKFWSLGIFILTLVFCVSGCKSCGSGRDPLLGKTRVDPPTTNARSVYVERQNVNECGVVPGGGCAASVSQEIPGSSNPAGIIQPGAGSVQTVHYPSGLDSVDEPGAASTIPATSQDQPPSEKAHLHWLSVETPQNEGKRGPSLSDLGTRELTEEELANYRYVYDFSVMPPRKVPVGRSAGASSETTALGNPAWGNAAENSAGNAAAQGSAPDPYVPQTRQFVSQNFDPYAPNRQFERRKAKLSRTMATEFDEAEPNPSPYSPPVQTANSNASVNETTYEPARVAQTQISAKDSGWRVVAAPDPDFAPSSASIPNEAVADSQVAPVQQAVGAKAQVPEKASEKVSAPEKVSGNERENARENGSGNVRENGSGNVREDARENVRENPLEKAPESPKMNEDSAVDLFALPRK